MGEHIPAANIQWRSFTHPDGRRWSIAACGRVLRLRFADPGVSDWSERSRTTGNPYLAFEEAERLVAEQLADGFVDDELGALLDILVRAWEKDDPSFPVSSLQEAILELPAPERLALLRLVCELRMVWILKEENPPRYEGYPEHHEARAQRAVRCSPARG